MPDITAESQPLVAETHAGNSKIQADRDLLKQAAKEGKLLRAFVKLSGPGWLQSAITLGGGSLAGALFLGVLGGTSMIWLQLMAITMGVIMLSAISYVTLSTGRRPFEAIKHDINPSLAWGWVIATCLANTIWCMPQFSLAYDALDKNLFSLAGGTGLGDSESTKIIVTAFLFIAATFVVLLNIRQGKAAKFFDVFLKALIGMVVICFFGVTVLMAIKGQIDFSAVFAGMVPDFSQWTTPAGELNSLVSTLPDDGQEFWTNKIVVENQRSVMIAAAATAVGINMTFLLPYSMLARGWDKPFRGLARFDLATGMAIPYVLVTTCVVIASAAAFHVQTDDAFLSTDPAKFQQSPLFANAAPVMADRLGIDVELNEDKTIDWKDGQIAAIAEMSETEKQLSASLVKRNAFQLSQTLSPLLGEGLAKLVFGLGVFGMGFSTIIILMLINGYAFREIFNSPDGQAPFVIGCLVAGLTGACWIYLWKGESKFWLPIIASTFGMMLLPIAYFTFFLMMNSKRILGDDKPRGVSSLIWNVLMGVSVLGALIAAWAAIDGEMAKSATAKYVICAVLAVFAVAILVGFGFRRPSDAPSQST